MRNRTHHHHVIRLIIQTHPIGREEIRRPPLGVCGVKGSCAAVSAVLNILYLLLYLLCSSSGGALQEARLDVRPQHYAQYPVSGIL